jgi:di- and tripeptidase
MSTHHQPNGKPANATATLSHSLNHDKSILALVVSSTNIIAGTEGGELLVRPPNLSRAA